MRVRQEEGAEEVNILRILLICATLAFLYGCAANSSVSTDKAPGKVHVGGDFTATAISRSR